MCASRSPMPADPARTEITLHGDTRLVAAVGAVVTHASQRLGITDEADGLSASAMEVVRGIIAGMGNRAKSGDAAEQVVVENHPGQLQVTIESPGDALSQASARSASGNLWDNTQFETRNGTSRVVLTKTTQEK